MKPLLRSRSVWIATAVLVTCALLLVASHGWAQDFPNEEVGAPRSFLSTFFGRLSYLAGAAALGFLIGAFLSPAAAKIRRLLAIVAAGASSLVIVGYALTNPSVGADALTGLLTLPAFIIACGLGLRLGARTLIPKLPEPIQPTSYGSAKWADLAYLKKHSLVGSKGFTLGEFLDGKEGANRLHYQGARHLLTVAPTRSGKGVSSIIPNLLTHGGSALVVDPKGENALITAPHRGRPVSESNPAGLGQTIVLLDPWNSAAGKLNIKPASFNPLDWIKPDDPDAIENAFLLADALVISAGGAESRFWDEEAKALLTGLILYVATAHEEAPNRTLNRVRDILTLDNAAFNDVLRKMYKHKNPVVSTSAARTAAKDAKLFSSVIASAQSHTHFLDSPRIRQSLARSDFKFEDLKTGAMTVYLILPADRLKTFDRWLRLLIQQAITVNARNIDVKPAKSVLFLLDEMAALGQLESVERAYGLMAGFGMQLWGIVQDLSQLAHIYGQHSWQTFISNSGVIQYFGSRDKMTAEYFSSLCGVTTIEARNFSWAVGYAFSIARTLGGESPTTTNTSTDNWTRTNGSNEAQRQLAYPDELMVLKGDQQIIFVENFDPILAQKIVWHQDAILKQLGVNLQASSP